MRRIIPSQDNYEVAVSDVRDIVAAFRKLGAKTIGALHEVARLTGICESRAHRLFWRDGAPHISDTECRRIRAGLVQAHRELAAIHRALAAEYEAAIVVNNVVDTNETFGDLTDGTTRKANG